MASVFKPFYALLEELRKIEKAGDGDLRIIPMTVATRQKTKTLLAWPIQNYVELQTSWKLISTTLDAVPEWPLGNGIAVSQEITKAPAESNTVEPSEATLKLVESIPTVKEARRALQTALKKIDPYYEIRSRWKYLPWIAGIGALGIFIALVFKASKSPALKGYFQNRRRLPPGR